MMTTEERLQKVLEYSGLNASAFAVAIGCKTKQAVYDLLHGKTKNLSLSMVDKITSYLPSVERTWLLTGEGEMLKQQEDSISNVHHLSNSILSTGPNSKNVVTSPAQTLNDTYNERLLIENMKAPIVPRAITKLPNLDVLEYVQNQKRGIEKARFVLEDEAVSLWYNVEDNALAPRIVQGDMVALMSNCKGMCEIVPGRVYAVDRKSTGINLRIFYYHDEGKLQAHSLNQEYKDFIIEPDDVIRIYRVICTLRFNN